MSSTTSAGRKSVSTFEFQQWVDAARNVNEDIKIALKADASTPYKTVKRVMNELQDMDESHYYMITQLKQQGDE